MLSFMQEEKKNFELELTILYLTIFMLEFFLKTTVVFEMSTLDFVKNEFLTNAKSFASA